MKIKKTVKALSSPIASIGAEIMVGIISGLITDYLARKTSKQRKVAITE
jgi:hypothetical protein